VLVHPPRLVQGEGWRARLLLWVQRRQQQGQRPPQRVRVLELLVLVLVLVLVLLQQPRWLARGWAQQLGVWALAQ
jgi:hypothetical protein